MKEADVNSAALLAGEAVVDNIKSDKSASAFDIYKECLPLLEWCNYLHTTELTGNANEFIDGFRSSIVETIFCVSSGLARLALFSMRAQIDISLSWLYFKDHPLEYAKVHKTSDGFMLKSAVMSYLEEYFPKFKPRFATLSAHNARLETDPYRLLSAHVHSQSKSTLPAASDFKSLIASNETSAELLLVQKEVTEFISDILFACFGGKWASLPISLVDTLKNRLQPQHSSIVLS